MRYATQKRVVLEVALIRLTRPAMETNLDSLLDRVRVLEKRIEEAPRVVYAPTGGQGDSAGKAKKPEPAFAAPEDLRRIVSEWGMIAGQTKGLLREILKNAEPYYDGSTGENILYIVFRAGDFISSSRAGNEEYINELKSIIQKRTGKTVEIRMITGEDGKAEALNRISVDEMIHENIHFDVDDEDD